MMVRGMETGGVNRLGGGVVEKPGKEKGERGDMRKKEIARDGTGRKRA
jgi:hypothetical protein